MLEQAHAAPAGTDGGGDEGRHAERADREAGEFDAGTGEKGSIARQREHGEQEGEEFEKRREGGEVVGRGHMEARGGRWVEEGAGER